MRTYLYSQSYADFNSNSFKNCVLVLISEEIVQELFRENILVTSHQTDAVNLRSVWSSSFLQCQYFVLKCELNKYFELFTSKVLFGFDDKLQPDKAVKHQCTYTTILKCHE